MAKKEKQNAILLRNLDSNTMEALEIMQTYYNEKTLSKTLIRCVNHHTALRTTEQMYHNIKEEFTQFKTFVESYLLSEKVKRDSLKALKKAIEDEDKEAY